jgi:CheY-like chemotaxis protein
VSGSSRVLSLRDRSCNIASLSSLHYYDRDYRVLVECITLNIFRQALGIQFIKANTRLNDSSKPTNKVQPLENSLSILIVDDVRVNQLMLSRRITRHILPNAKITEAWTGEEALKLCETETFDLIIMDQYMQEAGGILLGTDTVVAMRRIKIDSIIIGCSGNEMNASFTAAGTDWVWLKPVPSNVTMVQQIQVALEKRETAH